MSGARDRVLGTIRRSLKRDGADGAAQGAAEAAVEARLAGHPRNLIPARADLPAAERVDLFEQMATELAATVARVAKPNDVPGAVADYLKSENLPAEIRMAPDPELQALAWGDQPLLTVSEGPARETDPVSVTSALAGIAETGTLLLHSGPAGPTTLSFLPETNVVVLPLDRMVGAYEEAWDMLRERFGPGTLPRTVNFISGPSRSADIEQTIQLGAHGPRRLHIILVGS